MIRSQATNRQIRGPQGRLLPAVENIMATGIIKEILETAKPFMSSMEVLHIPNHTIINTIMEVAFIIAITRRVTMGGSILEAITEAITAEAAEEVWTVEGVEVEVTEAEAEAAEGADMFIHTGM